MGAWTDVHNLGDVVEEPVWLEPYPDASDPASRYQQHENVELAFVTALQHLPANQRVVLILREVLEFSAAEVAAALDTTVPAVNSALQRARKTVDTRILAGSQQAELSSLGKSGVEDLVARFVAARERADGAALLDMLADDARFAMPPLPAWFAGKTDIGRFLAAPTFPNPWRLQPITASGQIAFACHRRHPDTGPPDTGRFELGALNGLTLGEGRIVAMTGFLDPELHRRFGLAQVLTENSPTSR